MVRTKLRIDIFTLSKQTADECERPPFTMQKTTFYDTKGRVLQCKTRPFTSALIINDLQAWQEMRAKRCQSFSEYVTVETTRSFFM